MAHIVIIGPAHPLRGGGLASFNERLARQYQYEGHQVTIYTFSLQYPGFMFPGTTQYSTEPKPTDLTIKVCINSVNPLNWLLVGQELKKLKPDLIVVRYWLPVMGPCLGTILRIVKRNQTTKVVCIADNIIPHEKRKGDKQFTRYFIKPIDAFITMSQAVMNDLRSFTNTPATLVNHPLYDNFGTAIPMLAARQFLKVNAQKKVILFFGFIRKYKGLDILLEAITIIKKQNLLQDFKLIIAGEFYEEAAPYLAQIKENDIADLIENSTQFIADNEVKYYLCAADVVIQPYRNATQSGVTPLAYHFEVPMIVTNVGGLPAMVPNGKVGLVAEPNAVDIAKKIVQFFTMGKAHFLPYLQEEKKKYEWKNLTKAINEIA
jgi:glycosyltransferase involved in cell wall biosynthesis